MKIKVNKMKFETKAIHIGEKPNTDKSGDVVVPIHLSTTFARNEINTLPDGYEYSRTGNPTRCALEEKLAGLEQARFGLAFSSGMAAETTVLLSLLEAGDHIAASDDLYGGSRRLFGEFGKKFNIELSYVDARHVKNVEDSIKENTKLIWLETPTNPLLKLCDIGEISRIAHNNDVRVIVDNTFASPYFQNPLGLGADLVVHSTTKYINGHSDSVGGAVMVSDDELHDRLKYYQNTAGAILSPFDSYLTLRGTKTLALRMRKHERNAMKVAEYLESHPKVKHVFYPGLKSHPQHELAKKQMSGFGGMISFEIHGNRETAVRFLESLELFALAESLGGVESLIESPALMTHSSISENDRNTIGISESLIRMSVGIEDAWDIIKDIENGLSSV